MAAVSAGFTISGYLAEALTLTPTPQQTPGPFYPLLDDLPLGKDNDLLYLNDSLTAATGVITHITGRVLESNGTPIRNALVELWHADNDGVYPHSAGPGRNAEADPNFAGFGQFLTGASGAFRFRTIKAGLYPGRARHFHWGVTVPGRTTRFSTQTYWAGEPGNASDGVLNAITNAEQRASVILNFTPVPGTTTGEEQTTWDFISGIAPVEPSIRMEGHWSSPALLSLVLRVVICDTDSACRPTPVTATKSTATQRWPNFRGQRFLFRSAKPARSTTTFIRCRAMARYSCLWKRERPGDFTPSHSAFPARTRGRRDSACS
jgi:protocatechuate 3,4-dioxygenase beta subunit